MRVVSGIDATLLTSEVPLGTVDRCTTVWLDRWAAKSPDAVFLRERNGAGWRDISYADARRRAHRCAQGLLDAGASAQHPLAIVARNSIDHAVVMLAALMLGVPLVPLSVASARAPGGASRMASLLAQIRPALVFADAEFLAAARAAPVVTRVTQLEREPTRQIDEYAARVDGDSVAKVLFTSGSTGLPRGIVTTQGMLCANQTQLAQSLGTLADTPVVSDWLPWSHCYGGNLIVGFVLRNGGTLTIDDGNPVTAFERSITALAATRPTIHFNVPRGLARIASSLTDAAVRDAFERCRLIYSAGATLADDVRGKLVSTLAIPVVESWGATESAPLATFPVLPADAGSIGTPVPGCELRLVPHGDGYEVALRGPNVTTQYVGTNATAGNAEDFVATGDVLAFIDPLDPSRGLRFCGRVADNFKLSSATWVNVTAVRERVLKATAPFVDEVAIAGEGRDDVRVLLFLAPDAHEHPRLRDVLRAALLPLAAPHHGSASQIARLAIAVEPLSLEAGELTDKGSIDQRRTLARRAAAVDRLYAPDADGDAIAFSADDFR